MTLWLQHQQCHPNRVALCFQNENHQIEQLTWSQLSLRIEQYQACLLSQGMAAGDVLTLMGKNHPNLLFWLLAAHRAGITCAFAMPQPLAQLNEKLDTLYRDNQKAYVWLAPSAAIDAQDFRHNSRDIVLIEFHSQAHIVTSSQYHPDTLATIIFTSGSTGKPKAVAHTHAQHIASAKGLLDVFSYQESDTWLLSLPMYHVSGLAIIYRWLTAGACLKIGSGDLAQDISDVTHASLVPTQLKRLLESQQPLTLSHVLLGGSHIPHVLSQQAAQLGIETWLGYGMTEAASTVTAKPVDSIASAGKLLPQRQIKLEHGRIFIGGATLAQGYYDQGNLTSITDDNGWFDSKDLGEWLADELVIVGRADNLFISGGENVHCEEIEAVLNQHPEVQLAMVIAVDDAEFGARPIAVISSRQPFDRELGDLWCKDKLEKFKWPVAYFDMPESLLATGIKVSRKAVKDWLVTVQQEFTIAK